MHRLDQVSDPLVERGPSHHDATSRYTLIGELARGGLGRVFLATDDALGRSVAVKQPLSRTPETLARFEREAKLTSRLQHAGVVPIYDVGAWDDGQPFFVMKMVDGRSLDEAIRQEGSVEDRMALLPRVLAAADAVAYAHSQSVIHRDLKPANVVMSDYGETVVIDWGLARLACDGEDDTAAVGGDLGATDGLTLHGRVLGTPQFMPPEQAAGAPVDKRADVYALGAIVYNVLAGESPYGAVSAREVLSLVQGGPPRPLLSHASPLPPDLVAIVDKAMSREPADRYPSARELADDLRRFLNGQLVAAQRYSGWMLAGRWVRRHRMVAILLATLLVACVAGVVVVVDQRNSAVQIGQELEVRQNALVLLQAEQNLGDDATAAAAWLRRYHPTSRTGWRARVIADEAAAIGVARHVFNFRLPPRALAVSPDEPAMAAGWADGRLSIFDLDSGRSRLLAHSPAGLSTLAFAPRTRLLAAGDGKGTLQIWSTDGRLIRERNLAAGISRLLFDPEGRRLAVGLDHETVALLDATDDHSRISIALDARLSGLGFCPGTNDLLISDLTGRVLLVEHGAPRPTLLAAHHADARLLCLPGGRSFVTAGVDGEVRLWDRASGTGQLLGSHEDWVTSLAASRSGRLIASAGGDDTVRVFTTSGAPAQILHGHTDTVRGLAFSRDERQIASVAADSTVVVWDLATGESVREHRSRRAGTGRLDLTSDGRILVSGPQEARLWDFDHRTVRVFRGHTDSITALDWSPDSKAVASASRDRTFRVWPLDGRAGFTSEPLDGWTLHVNFLEQPGRVLVNTRLGRPLLFDLVSGTHQPVDDEDAGYSVPAVAGHRLAYSMLGGVFVRQMGAAGRMPLEGNLSAIAEMTFTKDGSRLAVATKDGLVGLWDAASGRLLRSQMVGERIYELALTPDAQHLAVTTASNRLVLWRPESNQIREIPGDRIGASDLIFTSDTRLLYVAADQTVRMIDVDSDTSHTLRGHRAHILDLAAAPAGIPWVVSSDAQGFVKIWDLRAGSSAVIRASDQAVDKAMFSPDGRFIATGGDDAKVRVWSTRDLVFSPAGSAGDGQPAVTTTAVIDENGTLGTP